MKTEKRTALELKLMDENAQLIIETEEIKTYRVKTTLAGVEKWFNKNFKE